MKFIVIWNFSSQTSCQGEWGTENKIIIKSKRQPLNLKKILTKAKFQENRIISTVTKCHRYNCELCDYLIEGNSLKLKCGKTLEIKENTSCDVKNVIYIIICKGCKEEYIGETKDLRARIRVHKQQIRDPNTRMLQMSHHIDNCTQLDPKFQVIPFFKCKQTVLLQENKKKYY